MAARLGWIPHTEAWQVGEELGWPEDVILHVLYEHGYRNHIREALEHLDLTSFCWTLEELPAHELVGATHHPEKTRVQSVAEDPHQIIEQRREKEEPFDMWPGNSWATPPFFIDGSLVNPPRVGLYLVEGHTRLGLLTGLVKCGEVPGESLHRCWVAREKEPHS